MSQKTRPFHLIILGLTIFSNSVIAGESCVDQYGCTEYKPIYCEALSPFRSSPTLFQWGGNNCCPQKRDLCEPLVTDRPDFTEASSTVGLGVSQIEFGYTFSHNTDSNTRTQGHSFGEPLLRYGIYADWLELRIAHFPQTERTTAANNTTSNSGYGDLYLGFKIALTPQKDLLPEMAIIPQMNVPTGSNGFTSDDLELGLNWIYSWEINEKISTAGSTQGNNRIDGTSGSAYLEMAQSWTIAYTLTEELGAYTEWYGLIPSGADTELTQHYFNGGFTYLITKDIQFDIRGGVGLNDASDDYFVGTGFSIRLP